MALLSKMAAAKRSGISRPTLYRHIKEGKVSVTVDDEDNECVDESELFRVYGKTKGYKKNSDSVKSEEILHDVTEGTPEGLNVELMQYKIKHLEKQLEESEARGRDLLEVVKNNSLALASPQSSNQTPEPEPVKKGLLDRILNR